MKKVELSKKDEKEIKKSLKEAFDKMQRDAEIEENRYRIIGMFNSILFGMTVAWLAISIYYLKTGQDILSLFMLGLAILVNTSRR